MSRQDSESRPPNGMRGARGPLSQAASSTVGPTTLLPEDHAIPVAEHGPASRNEELGPHSKQATLAPAVFAPTALLGAVTWLLMRSAPHRYTFVADFEWRFLPPLLLKQCRVFGRDNRPFAFVSWAFLTSHAEQRYVSRSRNLRLADWNAGDKAWLIDVIAPFGGADRLLTELKTKVFAGRQLNYLRLDADGATVRAESLADGEVHFNGGLDVPPR